MGAGEKGRRGGRSRTRGRRIGGLNRRRGIGTIGRRRRGGGGKIIYSGPGGSAIALAIIFIVLGIFLLVPGCVLLSSGLSNTWSGSGMLVPGIALLSMSGVLLITGITIFIVKKGCGGCNNSVGSSESETTTVVPATESSVPAATTSTTQIGANGQNDDRPKHIHINLQYTQMPGQPMPGQPMPPPGQFYPVLQEQDICLLQMPMLVCIHLRSMELPLSRCSLHKMQMTWHIHHLSNLSIHPKRIPRVT
ncbi:uncharacterized protein [Ptychodera flava]|uniref:uncharacterized protein n=1 Tax=Ptychodera flava TaxID=63121 RepID=UPI00396A8E16